MSYTPWRSNLFAVQASYALIAAVWGFAVGGLLDWPLTVATTLLLLGFARWQGKVAQAREYGKQLEQRVLATACTTLTDAGFQAEANRRMASGADIDLVVSRRAVIGHRRATVEIKAFGRWNTFFLFFNAGREQRAIAQARRQKTAAGAQRAVIWLPQGRKTPLQAWWWSRFPKRGGVFVVFGGTDELVAAMQKLL